MADKIVRHTDLDVYKRAFSTAAAETQCWLEFAVDCGYVEPGRARKLYVAYDKIIATLVGMINHPETWVITKR